MVTNTANTRWHTAIKVLSRLADFFNIGIFVHIIIPLLPFFLPAIILYKVVLILNFITYFADPLIYACKSLNRMTRYIGRTKGIKFIEEQYEHEWQDKADLGTSFLFLTAITAFFIPPSLFPLQSVAGWTAGLLGISINLYFDEIHPAKKAKEIYTLTNPAFQPQVNNDYKQHYYESLFYGLIILSLTLFLPSISVLQAYTLPTPLHALFNVIASVGSSLIVGLNLLRFSNEITSKTFYAKFPGLEKEQDEPPKEIPRCPESKLLLPQEHIQKSPVPFKAKQSSFLKNSVFNLNPPQVSNSVSSRRATYLSCTLL